MNPRHLTLAAVLTAASGAAAQAPPAQPVRLLIAGAQGSSEGSYSYAGVLQPIWGGQLGNGWYRKVLASWLAYRYDTERDGEDVTVRARAPGLEGGLGHVWNRGAFKSDLSLSVGVRHTRLRPDVPTDGPKGTRATLMPQWYASYAFSPRVDAEWLASYTIGTRDRFARVRLGLRPVSGWRVGPEAVVQAGPEYRNRQFGLFAGTLVAAGVTVDVNAGQARSREGKESAYLGVAVSKTF